MASIKIHQDLFNFERTRRGFTDRQIAAAGTGVAICVGMTALLGYAIGIPYPIAGTVGLAFAIPAIIAGFVPVYGMHAEEFAQRAADLAARGNTICWQGEHVEPMKCETTAEYRKRMREKGAECDPLPESNPVEEAGNADPREKKKRNREFKREKEPSGADEAKDGDEEVE